MAPILIQKQPIFWCGMWALTGFLPVFGFLIRLSRINAPILGQLQQRTSGSSSRCPPEVRLLQIPDKSGTNYAYFFLNIDVQPKSRTSSVSGERLRNRINMINFPYKSEPICLQYPSGEQVDVREGATKIGRDPLNDIVIKNKKVSRLHAILENNRGSIWVTDVRSANGTIVNDLKMRPGEKRELRDGDKIVFGARELHFIILGVTPKEPRFRFDDRNINFANLGLSAATSQELAERYQLIKPISSGGMGDIFLVQEILSRRFVALKVMQDVARSSVPHVQQFMREAIITARLQHPNIVPVYDIGFLERQELYYTMRYIEGKTFAEVMQTIKPVNRLEILRNVARAIHFAHTKGLWHRDLKPQNVLIGRHRDVYVIDWGLVSILPGSNYRLNIPTIASTSVVMPDKLIEYTEDAATQQDGAILGTPPYMAPEQLLADDSRMGIASDVWAIGVMLFQCMTDQHPIPDFSSLTKEELRLYYQQRNMLSPRRLATNVNRELHDICERMLTIDTSHRMQSIKEFIDRISKFCVFR